MLKYKDPYVFGTQKAELAGLLTNGKYRSRKIWRNCPWPITRHFVNVIDHNNPNKVYSLKRMLTYQLSSVNRIEQELQPLFSPVKISDCRFFVLLKTLKYPFAFDKKTSICIIINSIKGMAPHNMRH